MRIFEIGRARVSEHRSLAPLTLPGACGDGEYLWLSLTRDEFRDSLAQVQQIVQTLCQTQLVDLHVADLLNEYLPSHYDYTSQYDVLVFRRLASGQEPAPSPADAAPAKPRGGPPVLRRIDTRPVGFAVFDRVLLSVHPEDGAVRDAYATRLLAAASGEEPGAPALDVRATSARLPTSPADLMLRVINQIVDGYLDLRRELTKQLDHWQTELIDPRSRFTNWGALMEARQSLHRLDEICEDQRAAIQDWIDALETLPTPTQESERRERELIMIRSRDVLEHIERVVHHVHRLEQNAETAVQMHFSVQGHRANDIMRVLTVLTAVFLPLNLIAGIFGMNFEVIPLVHKADGFWIAMSSMAVIAVLLVRDLLAQALPRTNALSAHEKRPRNAWPFDSTARRPMKLLGGRASALLGLNASVHRVLHGRDDLAVHARTRAHVLVRGVGGANGFGFHQRAVLRHGHGFGAARAAGHVLVRCGGGAHGFGVDFVAALGRDGGVHALVEFRLGRRKRPRGSGRQRRGCARSSCQFLGFVSDGRSGRPATSACLCSEFPSESRDRIVTFRDTVFPLLKQW